MKHILVEIGNRYKYIRKNILNLTQRQLSQTLERDQSQISKIENGSFITLTQIIEICELAKIPLAEFFNFADLKNPSHLIILQKLKSLSDKELEVLILFLETFTKT